MMKTAKTVLRIACVAGVLALLAPASPALAKKPEPPPDGGWVSQASLDADTPGCPTSFDAPFCQEDRTSWDLDKSVGDNADGIDDVNYSFTVAVGEDTHTYLMGTGEINLSNSGEQNGVLSSIVLLLEAKPDGRNCPEGTEPAPGSTRKDTWCVLSSATAVRQPAGEETAWYCGDEGVTCYGSFVPDGGSLELSGSLEDVIASLDDDGDGLRDEDPANGVNDDGDGAIDEDGPCDAHLFSRGLTFEFDVTELLEAGVGNGIEGDSDDLRLDMIATFGNAGARGGSGASCKADINCSGGDYDPFEEVPSGGKKPGGANVRSIHQRFEFDLAMAIDPPRDDELCNLEGLCPSVHLEDLGSQVMVVDPDLGLVPNVDCVTFTTSSLDEILYEESPDPGPEAPRLRYVDGTLACVPCAPDMEAIQPALEDAEVDGVVTMWVRYPQAGDPSYFRTTLEDCSTDHPELCDPLFNPYEGWCVDTSRTIGNGTRYAASLTSSYDDAANDLVDWPGNLDEVNWIINQDYVGTPFQDAFPGKCGTDNTRITYGDVQRAIWALVENNNSTAGLGSYSNCRANEIAKAACGTGFWSPSGCLPGCAVRGTCEEVGEDGEGAGFVPEDCGQSIAVILNPISATQVTIAQVTLIDIPTVCPSQSCEGCTARVSNEATLACEDTAGGFVSGSPASAFFELECPPLAP